MRALLLTLLVTIAALATAPEAQELRTYIIVGDSIPDSLTGKAGDPVLGRSIVANRNVGFCLLCHRAPIPEQPLQGNLAPDLAGAGTRWSEGQLRMRMVDPGRLKADTIMPSYYRLEGLRRVAKDYVNEPILSAGEIEDVVAYLATLKEPRK